MAPSTRTTRSPANGDASATKASPTRTTEAAARERPARAASSVKTAYLVLYNFVSAVCWLTVLGRTAFLAPLRGYERVFLGVNTFLTWTQTAMGLEVLHALLGIVRSPVMTAMMQVASRYALVWGVLLFAPSVAASRAYTSMLLAWSTTEVVRYSFFAWSLATNGKHVPGWLLWLRYNTFFVLYPIGISSEVYLMWRSLTMHRIPPPYDGMYEAIVWSTLAIYPPGSYILYTHMMSQRRKVMKSLKQKE